MSVRFPETWKVDPSAHYWRVRRRRFPLLALRWTGLTSTWLRRGTRAMGSLG